ncbi:unnamed protein product [Echinostoma caproni]|uniref:Uncharacterized protein n=1 Tax=Echinostoma caproni TaxID=27848 RepID=A0A183ACN0_9TREM|nr:unnamed protein product [Echinostoma caproni]
MSLQSSELARATQTRAYRHVLRKTTGLRVTSCPAWRLPLNKVRARHLLAVFAGLWPPNQSTVDGITGDQRLAKLLTAPAVQVPFWLGSLSSENPEQGSSALPQPGTSSQSSYTLTEADVKAFESLIADLNFDECTGDSGTEASSPITDHTRFQSSIHEELESTQIDSDED